MHDVMLERLLEGDYAACFEYAQNRDHLTTQDLRWLAIAQYHRRDLLAAETLLLEAMRQGNQSALIELAMINRLRGDTPTAVAMLEQIQATELSALDFTLYAREKGIHQQVTGDTVGAKRYFELAWRSSQSCASALQSTTAHSLAVYYQYVGSDLQAIKYLRYALANASRMREAFVRISLAQSYINIRDFASAAAELAACKRLDASTSHVGLLLHTLGQLHLRSGDLEAARLVFLKCRSISADDNSPEMGKLARIGLLKTQVLQGERIDAKVLDDLCGVPVSFTIKHQARLVLAQTHAIAADREYITLYADVISAFREAGCLREVVEAEVSFVNALRSHDELELASQWENALVHDLVELSSVAPCEHHLSSCPHLREDARLKAYVHGLPPDGDTTGTSDLRRVKIVFFGEPYVLVDGHRATFQMTKSLEILFYLLVDSDRSLRGVQANLFPEQPEARSKNYFHQAKLDLKRATDCVDLVYDTVLKQYNVRFRNAVVDIDLDAVDANLNDVAGIGQAILALDTVLMRPFDNEWLESEREKLRQRVLAAGLTLVSQLIAQENIPEARALAERLLQIEPYHPELTQLVVSGGDAIPEYLKLDDRARRVLELYRQDLGRDALSMR